VLRQGAIREGSRYQQEETARHHLRIVRHRLRLFPSERDMIGTGGEIGRTGCPSAQFLVIRKEGSP
jgi:hypothetical protein